MLNVPIDNIYAVMQSTFGSLYVNDFTYMGRNFRVTLQSEDKFRRTPDDLRYVYVKSGTGALVPLATLIKVERVTGPELVNRFNIFPAAKIMGDAAAGYSSGQAIAAMEEVAAEVLGSDYALDRFGVSGKTGGRDVDAGVCVRADYDFPHFVGAVREMVAADCGYPLGAVCGARGVAGGVDARD